VRFPPEPSPKKQPNWLLISAIAGGILVCCTCGVLLTFFTSNSSSANNNAGGGGSSQPTATSAPAATNTPDQQVLAQAWAQAILASAHTVESDIKQINTDCANGSIQACRSDLVTFQGDVQSMQTVMRENPAPPCLATAASEINSALKDYNAGATLAIAGIDNSDTNEVTQGSAELNKGSDALGKATNSLNTAVC
jgi:hypothetical protein